MVNFAKPGRINVIPLHLQSGRLNIRNFTDDLLTDRYVGWLNDKEVVKYSEQRHKQHTVTSCRQYYESFGDSGNLFLAIISNQDDMGHIGNITVVIDKHNGLADIAILLGEKKIWGKGLGKEAWLLVLDYLRKRSDIRKVTAGTMSVNAPMLAIMKSSGMTVECIRKSHFLLNGNAVDLVMSAALAYES